MKNLLLILFFITSTAFGRTPEETVHAFYGAFARHDHETMGQLYKEGSVFNDAIFENLSTKETRAMWQMLLESTDLRLQHEIKEVKGNKITLEWIADYTYPDTGRQVHNVVSATLVVEDGLIVRHTDNFNLCKWSKMALGGFQGAAICVLPGTLRMVAKKKLKTFIKKSESN